MRYLETYSNDPEYNLSFEEYCFKYLPLEDEEYVFLWINSPAVIIGKNQNARREINSEYFATHDLKLIRRITGGGAVYHDLNNLNFSFVTKVKGLAQIDFKSYYQPIVNALRAIGVEAELSGRNDVTIDGLKCIGASQSIWHNRVLSNGCILFDVQLTELAKALNPDPSKLETKGVKSVRSRITNIKPHLKQEIDVLEFKAELLRQIFALRGEEPREYKLSEQELAGVNKVYNERFSRASWNWGRDLGAAYYHKRRFPSGSVELSFDLENAGDEAKARVKNLKIYGDFFGIREVSELEERLEGIPLSEEEMLEAISDLPLKEIIGAVSAEELVEIFFMT
ncbi:MAG: lipoate--protein ligase [Eubacteriales bacterium]|nr:lipoate--protein ligase [Eubacteriales bacterium]